MTQDIAIFKAMSAKMGYLDHRQKVLAQNIANADTPHYQARELTEINFDQVLKGIANGDRLSVSLNTTNSGHMPPPNEIVSSENRKQKITYEEAPAGNAVIIEEQMVKASQNTMDYNLMTNLYSKHIGMMRTALGRGQ